MIPIQLCLQIAVFNSPFAHKSEENNISPEAKQISNLGLIQKQYKDIVVDMSKSSESVMKFKEHLLQLINQSPSTANKYLLWVFLAKNEEKLEKTKYSLEPSSIPNENLQQLQELVGIAMLTNSYLVLTLQKYQTKSTGTVQKDFDSSGRILKEKEHILNHERPSHKIYPCDAEPQPCAFCRQLSSSEILREKVGPVYGPIKIKKNGKSVWVHELCAIWTPEVFLDGRNKFKNMKDAVKRGNILTCTFCKERGAGLGCFVKGCQNTFHYLCARNAGCLLVRSRFIMYCDEHRHEEGLVPEEDQMEDINEENSQLDNYICSICKSGLDEAEIIICDNCDKGFHSNCHIPSIPKEVKDSGADWFCAQCVSGQNQILSQKESQ